MRAKRSEAKKEQKGGTSVRRRVGGKVEDRVKNQECEKRSIEKGVESRLLRLHHSGRGTSKMGNLRRRMVSGRRAIGRSKEMNSRRREEAYLRPPNGKKLRWGTDPQPV